MPVISSGINLMELTMTDKKSVMVIDLEPTLIDFAAPFFAAPLA
jgi:hypothetical protein